MIKTYEVYNGYNIIRVKADDFTFDEDKKAIIFYINEEAIAIFTRFDYMIGIED